MRMIKVPSIWSCSATKDGREYYRQKHRFEHGSSLSVLGLFTMAVHLHGMDHPWSFVYWVPAGCTRYDVGPEGDWVSHRKDTDALVILGEDLEIL
jgi:hypothetical protein